MSAFTGRCGPLRRLVIGADAPPPLPFQTAEELAWDSDPVVVLGARGEAFALIDRGERLIAGTVDAGRFRLTLDVGDAEVFGFGAANGAVTRNDSRFRVMTIDTLMYASSRNRSPPAVSPSFRPAHDRLELRVPAGRFGVAVVDGRRFPLTRRVLDSEDRATAVDTTRVPLDAQGLLHDVIRTPVA